MVFFFLGCFFSWNLFAWNATGHRLITQIALDQCSPVTKKKLSALHRQTKMKGSLLDASVWLDKVRYVNPAFPKTFHFIDIPFSTESKLALPPAESMNAVIALRDAESCWFNLENCTPREKGLALRVILHLVGDLHQPLHAVTRITRDHPEGDQGGNLVLLPKNRVAPSLHAYWDQGAGLFSERLNRKELRRLAQRIEARWPCDSVSSAIQDPMKWAEASHQLAVQKVYRYATVSDILSPDYQKMADEIVMQQVSLAGCRLAVLLQRV